MSGRHRNNAAEWVLWMILWPVAPVVWLLGRWRRGNLLADDSGRHIVKAMTPDALAAELDRDPFIPLRLHLSDGRTIDVVNPGLCFIARMTLYFFRARPHESLAEDVQLISMGHIVSVETLAPVR